MIGFTWSQRTGNHFDKEIDLRPARPRLKCTMNGKYGVVSLVSRCLLMLALQTMGSSSTLTLIQRGGSWTHRNHNPRAGSKSPSRTLTEQPWHRLQHLGMGLGWPWVDSQLSRVL